MSKAKYLYHVTTAEALPSILKNGLKPKIGGNAKRVNEFKKFIYLCPKKSVGYWKIVVGGDVVLRIPNRDEYHFEDFKWDNYLYETMCDVPIPPEDIEVITVNTTVEQMRTMAYMYTLQIGLSCIDICEYYDIKKKYKNTQTPYDDIVKRHVDIHLPTLYRINFDVLTTKEKRTLLKGIGADGECTFLDYYKKTGHKMYELLDQNIKTKYHEQFVQFKQWIIDEFGDCLDLNTGGYKTA